MGPQDPQNGALKVPPRSLLVANMRKLEPPGSEINILELIGITLSQISIILQILVHFGNMFDYFYF